MTPAIAEAPSRTEIRKEIARVFEIRRRSLRIDVLAGLIAFAPATGQADVALMEESAAGFRIATTEPVPVDAVFMSELMNTAGKPVNRLARVAYCQRQPASGHDGGYVSRLDFIDGDAA